MSKFLPFVLLLLVAVLCIVVSDGRRVYDRVTKYHNDVVVTCYNGEDERVRIMMNNDNIDVWKVHPSGKVEMQMTRAMYQSVDRYVSDVCHVSIQDVEAHVQSAEEQMLSEWQRYHGLIANSQELNDENLFKEYHDLKAITMWYKKLACNNPHLVKLVDSIGTSVEGREIFAVHITSNANAHSATPKPKFYLQCLIHAREWISGSACMYLANSLVKGYRKDSEVTHLVNAMEYVIVPVVNPDGYEYTWTNDRMWRKNRARISSSSSCYGVDLNRNFAFGWGNGKSACSQTYSGPSKESEPETQAIIQYYRKNTPIVAAIDFHSYGQLVLRPYGFKDLPRDKEALMADIGQGIVDSIRQANNQVYTSQESRDLYESHGIASDWFYSKLANGEHASALSYTIELRPNDPEKGFLLPKNQIIATCQDANKAFLYLSKRSLQYSQQQQSV